jgi:hypothetical protein
LEGGELAVSASAVALLYIQGFKGIADFLEILPDCRLSNQSPRWVGRAILIKSRSMGTEGQESDPYPSLPVIWTPATTTVEIQVQ